jgi:FkbM family methyltransferase
MLGATSRARAHVVDGVRATRVFADPVALLSAYVRGAGLHGSVVRLRDGVEIETSSSALDPATLMVVLVREEYAPIPVGGLVVDVGGNIGAFALYAVRAGARRVLTFEPSRDAYAVLRRNVQRNGLAERIVAERRAVVGRAGEDVWFPTASSPANHIIDDPAALEAARAAGSVERVPTTSLAEIVDAHGEIDLLKLDCEGAEYGIVAATPAAAWARVGSVRIEYHAGQADELTFTLVRYGFRVSRHAPDPAWPKAIGMLHLERT